MKQNREEQFTIHDLKDLVMIYGDNEDYAVNLWCPSLLTAFEFADSGCDLKEIKGRKYIAENQWLKLGGGLSSSKPGKELNLIVTPVAQKNGLFETIDQIVDNIVETQGQLEKSDYRKRFLELLLEKLPK